MKDVQKVQIQQPPSADASSKPKVYTFIETTTYPDAVVIKIEIAGAEGWRDFIADMITEFVESLSGKPPKLEKRARRPEQPKRTKKKPQASASR